MISLNLRQLRMNAGMKQADVANHLKITREAYSQYETGKRQMTYESLDLLADYYHVTVDCLLGREESIPLSKEESTLLNDYRRLDHRGMENVKATLSHEKNMVGCDEVKKSAT